MRASARIVFVLAGWFALCAASYVAWCLIELGRIEWAGSSVLLCAMVGDLMVAFFLVRARRSVGGELPEDRPDANIADGAGDVGEFAPFSWWPVMLAAALGLIFLGVAVAPWLAMIGVPFLIIALVGWMYEGYRGHASR